MYILLHNLIHIPLINHDAILIVPRYVIVCWRGTQAKLALIGNEIGCHFSKTTQDRDYISLPYARAGLVCQDFSLYNISRAYLIYEFDFGWQIRVEIVHRRGSIHSNATRNTAFVRFQHTRGGRALLENERAISY